jgi:multiple sugar transport system substrate-binding protein
VQHATYLAGEHLAIFKQSRHPQQAWTFVKWILRPVTQAMFSMKSGYLPVRRSVLERKDYQDFLATDPALKAFVDQMSWGQGRRPIIFHRVEINRCLAEAIEKATLGKMDPKAALDEAAAKANKLLQPVGKMQLN